MGRRTKLSAPLAAAALAAAACILPAAAQPHCPTPPSEAPARTAEALDTRGLRVGLALGSGSMHGLAHIGVIQELEARGVDVGVVAGTSVGALVGALWASGLDGAQIAQLGRSGALDEFAEFSPSWQGLYKTEGASPSLEVAFRNRPIEKWPKRFGAVATHVDSGERRVVAWGDGATAVRASSAVPVIFRPVVVREERLVDGALVEPVPVHAARDLGADFVIAIDVAYRPYEGEASGVTEYAFQALHILVNSLAAEQLRAADVAIRLDLHHELMTCGREALVEAGRLAVRNAWPRIRAATRAARKSRPLP